MAKKHEICTLMIVRNIWNQQDHTHTSYEEWSLVKVAAATRDGIVTAIDRYGFPQKLKFLPYLPKVMVIGGEHQAKACKVYVSNPETTWDSAEALRAAILAS